MPPPARSVSLLLGHLAVAHLFLLAALCWLAVEPEALSGSPFDLRALAVTHLVTLGCILVTVVGSWQAVLPIALRVQPCPSTFDGILLAAMPTTAVLVASGMAWGRPAVIALGGGVLLPLLLVHAVRNARPLAVAKGPLPLRVGVAIACFDLLLAAVLGILVALDRDRPLLPEGHLAGVLGHAHLALGGFAGTLLAAVGLRLLPMFLPAAPLPPAPAWIAVIALGLGGPVQALAAWWGEPALQAGGWLLAIGAATWLGGVAMLLRRRLPRPAAVEGAAPSRWLVATGVLAFAAALPLGVLLLSGQVTATRLRTAYGVLLLGGFVSAILGIGQRLAPLLARLASGHGAAHTMPSPTLARLTAALWPLGFAALVSGIAAGPSVAISAGAAAMAIAVLADLLGLRRIRRTHAPSP